MSSSYILQYFEGKVNWEFDSVDKLVKFPSIIIEDNCPLVGNSCRYQKATGGSPRNWYPLEIGLLFTAHQNMTDWVNRRWYGIAELGLVFTCATLMLFLPAASGWLFLISLLPSLGRLLSGAFPYKKTPLDIPMALFLITACVGVWASYDRDAAWAKFWLLAEAILIFYVISRQPERELRVVASLIIALEIFLVSLFLLTYDWRASPIEFNLLNQIGMMWENLRPQIPSGAILADKAGDLIATFLPFTLLLVVWYPKTGRRPGLLFGLAVIGYVLLGLLLASSITSWLALAVACGVWLVWWAFTSLAKQFPKKRAVILGTIILLIAIGTAAAGFILSKINIGILDLQHNTNISVGRFELASDTFRLLNDYPFTGGGLAAFPGQYSYYILNIPFFFFNHSESLFLDVAFEQSPVGLLTLLAILGGSFWLLFKNSQKSPLWWAVLMGLIVVTIQSLADDPLYGGNGTALLFVLPGLAVALGIPGETKKEGDLLQSADCPKGAALDRPTSLGRESLSDNPVMAYL